MESSGKELEKTYKYMFNLPGVKKYFDDAVDPGFQFLHFKLHIVLFSLKATSCSLRMTRFLKCGIFLNALESVFEQTYTRFLDLQKAEAQAREAQIEAALERVRSRTMAMQQSDELAGSCLVIFQQVKH